MRCGILGLLQESNTFLPQHTTYDHFVNDVVAIGSEVVSRFVGSQHEMGGFIDGLQTAGIEIVPIFAARALPYGAIERPAFDRLISEMCDALESSGPLDGVLAAAHGATVCESILDADGYWLGEMRRRIGTDIPLIATIDSHANLSASMVDACDAIIGYRTNPHVDQRARGVEAAELMDRTLRGEVQPTMAAAFPPLAMSIECQSTEESPCRELCLRADALRQFPGVISASLVMGFPYADVPEMGSAAIAVTDGDLKLAEAVAQELAAELWSHRRQLVGERIGVEEALDRALLAAGPVCILDMGDNVGAGSPGDSTWIARSLLRRGVLRSLVVLDDAAAVATASQSGIESRVRLSVGGRSGPLGGEPLVVDAFVRGIFDGRFSETLPVHGGFTTFDQGPTAVLETGAGPTILVTSNRMVPFSLAQLTSCELDPSAFAILVAKGVNAPIAAYRKVCQTFLRVDSPGYTACDMTRFDFHQRRRPMFPFEPDCTWESLRAAHAGAAV